MSTRRETIDRLKLAIDNAALVATPVFVEDVQQIDTEELPAIGLAWISDEIDDEGTTSEDGSSLQTRVLEIEVHNVGTSESQVEDLADALEDIVFGEFQWADFISAVPSASTPEEGDQTLYGIAASFGVQYEKKIAR